MNERGSQPVVAVLYQAHPAPAVDGIAKPFKPGGYRDSGADIACALRREGVAVVTPVAEPAVESDADWVFPDDRAGVERALDLGATVLWANTVLHSKHALEQVDLRGADVVGQRGTDVERWDDKYAANRHVAEAGIPVARSFLYPEVDRSGQGSHSFDNVGFARVLAAASLEPPLVIKPVRGRGSQGVTVVSSVDDALIAIRELTSATAGTVGANDRARLDFNPGTDLSVLAPGTSLYGCQAIVEEYLPGEELTLSVLPPGEYKVRGVAGKRASHWALPAVRRFNHRDGVAPYSGVVAVAENSHAVQGDESTEAIEAIRLAAAQAAQRLDCRALIRIDCRADAAGRFKIFDINLKPNMTGPGRPGRDGQQSLTAIAAREIGWSYGELVWSIVKNATAG